jgi:outer membrane protein OmpA-like peptidoglycan-associated protein
MRNTELLTAFCLACLLTACAGSPSRSAASIAPAVAADTPPAPAKPSDESVSIAFDTADATLSPAAVAQLDGAARLYRDAHPEVMIVAGHTDKTGDEFDNLILSARRAEAVKQALADRGVPADRLQVVAMGEAEPVPSIPASRSAVITWR